MRWVTWQRHLAGPTRPTLTLLMLSLRLSTCRLMLDTYVCDPGPGD